MRLSKQGVIMVFFLMMKMRDVRLKKKRPKRKTAERIKNDYSFLS